MARGAIVMGSLMGSPDFPAKKVSASSFFSGHVIANPFRALTQKYKKPDVEMTGYFGNPAAC